MSTQPTPYAIAITGFGTVGREIARLVHARQAHYRERHGVELRVTGVCGASAGLCDAAGLSPAQLADATQREPGLSGERFMQTVQADVLFEASPTNFRTGGAALGYMRAALARRMHVVALSKGALALDHAGLQREAQAQGVQLKLSGATASALPTVDLLQYNLAGCEVRVVEAILTGTTNLILSAMMERGVAFDEALREAQRLGIAESDPTLDTEGWDTACKLVIIANAAFNAGLDVQTLPRSGITHVGLAEVQTWREQGRVPRLVGRLERGSEGRLHGSVQLQLYASDHPFAQVGGRVKAIRVETDVMGEFTVIGGGSAPEATAAAALKDLEHILAARSARLAASAHAAPPAR